MTGTDRDSFPRQYARTQRFTLGAPRTFSISEDGRRVLFVRSRGGTDPVGVLWALDVATGDERCLADPASLGIGEGDLPPEERARRERARESAGGIVAYATDRAGDVVAFSLGGTAHVVDVATGGAATVPVAPAVLGPRPSPAGDRLAYVRDGALWVADRDGSDERRLAGEDDPDVTWGLPEFVAAEEMGRMRGLWWAPDGSRLAVARVDTGPVVRWHIADPAHPARRPTEVAYPAAGTPNADVSLHVVGLDGRATEVTWDRDRLPYLADVVWAADAPLTVVVQSRDQRTVEVLTADPATGGTTVVHTETDDDWVELVPGVPRWLAGSLVWLGDDRETDTRRLSVGGRPVTPAGLQVRSLLAAHASALTFTASSDDPTAIAVWRVRPDVEDLERLTDAAGVAAAVVGRGGTTVTVARDLDRPGARVTVTSPQATNEIASLAQTPTLRTVPRLLVLGERRLRGALLLPSDHTPGSAPLPVLLDPYGGPHAQRVLRSNAAHLSAQWFADQGFAVLVVDGRGSPGRGPEWERTLAGDLATAPLEDQVDALHACAAEHPGLLDLDRVAIRGWSFGGYLAALAVLRRPDVFAAAIAGAPVTDWSLYDTHYTERYLGTPGGDPEAYRRSSLIGEAAQLDRPLLLIHGLADDNVVAAHTLHLSQALLEAGRWHTVLPLSGVTHMTPQEEVAENLLRLQLQFLRQSLGIGDPGNPLRAGVSSRS